MSVVPVLLLTQKAEVKSSKITLGNSKELTLKHIQTYCKKKRIFAESREEFLRYHRRHVF